MRLSPLALAIALVLCGCNKTAVHEEAAAYADPGKPVPVAAVPEADEPSPVTVDAPASLDAISDKEEAGQRAQAANAAEGGRRDAAAKTRQAELKSVAAMAYAQPVPAPAMAPPPPPPASPAEMAYGYDGAVQMQSAEPNTEHYQEIEDNPIHLVSADPVSTFSIDVDTGSYSNVRRMLASGVRPPKDSVRAEEMINYFDYGYPAPTTREVPFLVNTEVAPAPWNPKHELLQVGIQGYRVDNSQIPAANLVFLIDTSGSMSDPDKLPLLKQAFAGLVEQLRPQDRITLVAYAGSAGLVLPPTSGANKPAILAALNQLESGGSTNGGQGLQLAYAMAKQAYIRNGVNRVLLATDGDFNVGTFDQKALETVISDQRKSGIALTTLGFGTGNYNDAMAERLADLGNGNHAYIDSLKEANKVLSEELSSTMLTIAQDVKIQVEFNPAVVAEYRLIGYENRALRREDFNNDQVDAGEIGAGHDVTALYELTLVGSDGQSVDPLRYGPATPAAAGGKAGELGLLRLRYKQPGAETSRLIEKPLAAAQVHAQPSPRLRWSASVAAYADLLRGGKHMGNFGWGNVRALAAGAIGEDRWGYRAEFLELVDKARAVTGDKPPVAINE